MQRSANSSYSRPRSARKRDTMAAFTSGAEAGMLSTNPIPPCRSSPSRNCSSNSACGPVSGSTHALLTIVVAPTARRRRHSATRGLDAEPRELGQEKKPA